MNAVLMLVVWWSLLLAGGCATSRPMPEDWASEAATDGVHAGVPLGRFANQGESSDPKVAAPTLSALLFDKLLEGFDIDNVVFAPGETDSAIRIRPHVGEIALREERVLEGETSEEGPVVWTAKTDTRYADGYEVTASILWTGGALMPIAHWKNYRFRVGNDGDLVVQLHEKEIVNFFYLFPVPFSDELWLRYPSYVAQPTGNAP